MSSIKLFENMQVRSHWHEQRQAWFFSIVDVVAVLTHSVDAPAYWRKLKQLLKAEGNETVTNCHGLKMTAPDGKLRLTHVADTEQLLRLVQSIPSPTPVVASAARQSMPLAYLVANSNLSACFAGGQQSLSNDFATHHPYR